MCASSDEEVITIVLDSISRASLESAGWPVRVRQAEEREDLPGLGVGGTDAPARVID